MTGVRARPSAISEAPADLRLVAVRTLWIDRTSKQVLDSLTAEGIETVLLKGPTTARWLYRPGERNYLDLDVLIDAVDTARVDRVLRESGYRDTRKGARPDELDDHAWNYRRLPGGDPRPGVEIDLHYTLPGAKAPASTVWAELSRSSTPFPLCGGVVTALDEVGRALVLVLHAARDARRKQQSFEDLRRLVEHLPDEKWVVVAGLARRIGALESFAAGLLLLDDGAERLARLGVPRPALRATMLYSRAVPITAHRVEQLATTRGVVAKTRLAARELWPTPAWLTWWAQEEGMDADARLALRVRRIAGVLRATPEAVAAWLRVRRAFRRQVRERA
jgi:hypothetical protein